MTAISLSQAPQRSAPNENVFVCDLCVGSILPRALRRRHRYPSGSWSVHPRCSLARPKSAAAFTMSPSEFAAVVLVVGLALAMDVLWSVSTDALHQAAWKN